METAPKPDPKFIFILVNLPDGNFIVMDSNNLFGRFIDYKTAKRISRQLNKLIPKGMETKVLKMTLEELGTLFDTTINVQIKTNGMHLAEIVHRENINQYIVEEEENGSR